MTIDIKMYLMIVVVVYYLVSIYFIFKQQIELFVYFMFFGSLYLIILSYLVVTSG